MASRGLYVAVALLGFSLMLGMAMLVIPFSNSTLLDIWWWLPSHFPMWFVYPFESFILDQMAYVGAVVVGISGCLLAVIFHFNMEMSYLA